MDMCLYLRVMRLLMALNLAIGLTRDVWQSPEANWARNISNALIMWDSFGMSMATCGSKVLKGCKTTRKSIKMLLCLVIMRLPMASNSAAG